MPQAGGPSTLAHLAKQKSIRAKTALALGITSAPREAPLRPNQPPQPAKTEGITADEEMFAEARRFLQGLG